MESMTLKRDGEADLRFTGELIAETGNSWDTAHPDYSGRTGEKDSYGLYKTKAGKFVCHRIGYTQWQGRSDTYEAKVCENEAEVVAFFGHGKLAKELFESAGIDATEEVA